MIPYIDEQLRQWAMWCLTGRDKLGFPRQSAFLNGQPVESKGRGLEICDEVALEIQGGVNSLHPDLKRTVVLFYLKMRSCDSATIARAMRIHRDTLYDRLHRAHLKVSEYLDERRT
jgi:DNA-directed RNA polymerase specialized sigma24 family protein